jgi:hypothetical protein
MIKDYNDITIVLFLFVRLAKIFEIRKSSILSSNQIEKERIEPNVILQLSFEVMKT